MSKEENRNNQISRRQFLKRAAGASAAVAAGTLITQSRASAQAVPGAPTRWDKEADVVVIGAGCTGLPAAIVAQARADTPT